jgi:hypothetical protein
MEKLVPNLQDKKDYVVDIRNLKFYLDHGLVLKKVSSVISFKQSTYNVTTAVCLVPSSFIDLSLLATTPRNAVSREGQR